MSALTFRVLAATGALPTGDGAAVRERPPHPSSAPLWYRPPRSMKPLCPALTLALALVAFEARAQPAATLRYRYVAGTTARYTTRTSQTMPGTLGTTVTTSTHDVETVRVLPDGSAEQRMRIASMEMAGANVPAPVRERVTAAMRGLVIEYTVDARGRVAARRTVGEVLDKANVDPATIVRVVMSFIGG